jgi:hypothetical protein
VVIWILGQLWLTDTPAARDRPNHSGLSAFDRKKDFEINTIPFFFFSETKIVVLSDMHTNVGCEADMMRLRIL